MPTNELMFPVIIPVIFMVLVVVTGAMMVVWQQVEPILNQTYAQTGVNATDQALANSVGNNVYQFDTYLVIIFYVVMVGALASTIWLNPSPLAILAGVIYIPFIYYLTSWIQNIARTILMQPIFASSLSHLPLSIIVLSQLNTISVLFGLGYIILTSVRFIWWHRHGSVPLGGGSAGMGY